MEKFGSSVFSIYYSWPRRAIFILTLYKVRREAKSYSDIESIQP
jgi:hypothetical protein